MADYCSEDDLVAIRPDILDLGVADWSTHITEAGTIIDRVIDAQWYRGLAVENGIDWRETPFDRDKLLNAATQLKRLACYKTLELAFLYVMKHAIEDAFERERKLFRELYTDELSDVLIYGLDYDWDDDASIDAGESVIASVRRLTRV